MPPKVFITRQIPDKGLEIIDEAGIEYTVCPNYEIPPTKEEIIQGIHDCDGLISLLCDPIDKDVLGASENLKIVSQYAVGYNNIDIEEAKRLQITVTNTPGVLTQATADVTFGLMIATARRMVESDKYMRAGRFKGWYPLLHVGEDVYGAALGIVGAGRIGTAVARRAKGFDMEILYHNRNRNLELEKETGARYVSFDELLERSDFVTVHTPLTPETRHLFGAEEFRKMKNTAIFINTARGEIMDERALVLALRNGDIKSAGLDVYENEPEFTKGMEELDNVVMVAHIGSASISSRTNMAIIAAQNLVDFFQGREPRFKVC